MIAFGVKFSFSWMLFILLTFGSSVSLINAASCPKTVPSTDQSSTPLPMCTHKSNCTSAGDECCDVTSGGTHKVCIKGEHPPKSDDEDCDKKSSKKEKDECEDGKKHKFVKLLIIIVASVVVVIICIVVGCVIRAKYCKKKVFTSTPQVTMGKEKNEKILGRDYSVRPNDNQQEQNWLSINASSYTNNPPPSYKY